MNKAEFDKFAEEYRQLHARNIAITGEDPEFFARYKVIDALMLSRQESWSPQTILDFGSGVGNSSPHFQQFFPRSRLICADVSPRSLALGKERFPDLPAQYVQLDTASIPLPDASVDLAFTACVFHHITHAEHDLWLRELRRVVRPGGRFLLFEHNPLNPLTRAAVRDCPFDQNAQLIRARQMQQRLEYSGWRNVRIRYRLFFPHALRQLRHLESYLTWLPLGAQYSIWSEP